MTPEPGPVLRRRQAGTWLRALREATGKSLDDVAGYLECSAAKISRIETGRTTARVPDVRNMLDLYQTPPSVRNQILDLVRESRRPGWWHVHGDAVTEGMDTFIGLLDAAATIAWYEPHVLPGLLQTPDYTHGILAPRMDVEDDRVDRLVALRTDMATILTRDSPPAARFIIEEATLHRPAGSPTIMTAQLIHLTELARLPHITIQIMPTSAGFAAPGGFPLVVFTFPDPTEPPVAFSEQFWGLRMEHKPDQVARYTLALDSLRHSAHDPDRSLETIAALAYSI